MFGRKNIPIEGSWMPANTDIAHKRVTDVAEKLDIQGRATLSARKEEPHSDDKDLDENQRVIVTESASFVPAATRRAAAEIAARRQKVRERIPRRLEALLEQATIRRQVAEARDRYRSDLDRAFALRQRKWSALRAFEERNRRDAHSAHYKTDKAMFGASLLALTIAEGGFNAFSFQEMQDQGLLGGLLLAMTVSVANVLMGVGTGWLGWRLMGHIRWSYKLLGASATAALMSAAWTLHLALGHLRQAITQDAKATVDFLVVLSPSRWFAFTGIAPFIVIAIGAGTYLIAAFKGRGGSFGIVAPYWGHEIVDREFREADRALEDAKENFISAMMNAFDSERLALRARLRAEEVQVAEIRELVMEAEAIERSLGDSIQEEIQRLHLWLRTYRERNKAVRTTPAPTYFETYPEFEEWRTSRLDLSEIRELAARAEELLTANTAELAAIENKMVQEQTAAIESMLTAISASARRGAQQVEQDDGAGKPSKM